MRERRCYVCNALPQDGCQAIGGEVAECPRPTVPQTAPRTTARKCRSGRPECQMEPDWQGRHFDYMKCHWCGRREAV